MNYELRIKKILLIDTSSNEEIVVGLSLNNKTFEERKKIAPRQSHVILSMIDALLASHNMSVHDLTGIDVATGPGSYTGLRIGAAIANALMFTLHIPVDGKPLHEIVTPDYS